MKEPPPIPPPHPQVPQARPLEEDVGMRMLMPVGRTGWSIAAGYLGLFSLIILPGPVALAISLIAIFDIRKAKKEGIVKRGMGRAIFGLIMGILATGLIIVVLIAIFLEGIGS